MNPPASLIKRSLLFLLKIALSLAILVCAGYFSIAVCPRIWPSLSHTVDEPKTADFCGRYIPMPATAEFLAKKYPGTNAWLEFREDGSFVFSGSPIINQRESGQWKLIKGGGRVLLTLSEDGGLFLNSNLRLKSQKPPYIVECWKDFPMEFCTSPQTFSTVRAYKQISITDLVIQGTIVLSVLVLPFFLREGSGLRAYGYPFMLILVWGIWRMAYFDPTTRNDIPGIGYLICAFVYPVIPRILFSLRWAFVRKRSQKNPKQRNQLANKIPPPIP